MILVFRHGVGSCLLGFQRVDSIEAWVPLFLFSVLFGLSMDYQVFLLSRIKERYDASGSTTEAVTYGVASTARLVPAAMRLQRLLPSLIEDFGAEKPAEEIRACADLMLQPFDDAPVRSFVLTLARRNAQECLREGRGAGLV